MNANKIGMANSSLFPLLNLKTAETYETYTNLIDNSDNHDSIRIIIQTNFSFYGKIDGDFHDFHSMYNVDVV